MLKLATTPQEHDAATNNNEGKTHPVPTTHTPSTNYADNRYQQPLFRTPISQHTAKIVHETVHNVMTLSVNNAMTSSVQKVVTHNTN